MNCAIHLPDGRKISCDRHSGFYVRDSGSDGLMIEGSWGFNDLGGYFSNEIALSLGVDKKLIRSLCEKHTHANEEITLIAIPSSVPDSALKAAVFVPTELGRAYSRFATSHYGRPYRDFYYNVVYEALDLLTGFGCRAVSIAGLRGFPIGHTDIDTCTVEAIAHFAMVNTSLERVISVGCGPNLSTGAKFFNEHPERIGQHREIRRRLYVEGLVTKMTIELPEKQLHIV